MRNAALVLAAAALIGCPLAAHAGGTHWFGYELGAGVPLGSLSGDVNIAPAAGVTYTYMVTPVIGLGAEIAYYRWPNSRETNVLVDGALGTEAQYKQSDWQTTVHGVLALPIAGRVQPYLTAGVGYYAAKYWLALDGQEYWDGEQWLGHELGGGINVRATRTMAIGVSAVHHQYGDNERGRQISYLSGMAQIVWKMPWSTRVGP